MRASLRCARWPAPQPATPVSCLQGPRTGEGIFVTTSETGAHLIDGEWVTSSATGISMNPARPDEPVGEYPLGDGVNGC